MSLLSVFLVVAFVFLGGFGGFKYLEQHSASPSEVIKHYSFPMSAQLVFVSVDCLDAGLELTVGSKVSVAIEPIYEDADPEKATRICLPIEALIDAAIFIEGMKFVQLTTGSEVPQNIDDLLVVTDNRDNIVGYFEIQDTEPMDL